MNENIKQKSINNTNSFNFKRISYKFKKINKSNKKTKRNNKKFHNKPHKNITNINTIPIPISIPPPIIPISMPINNNNNNNEIKINQLKSKNKNIKKNVLKQNNNKRKIKSIKRNKFGSNNILHKINKDMTKYNDTNDNIKTENNNGEENDNNDGEMDKTIISSIEKSEENNENKNEEKNEIKNKDIINIDTSENNDEDITNKNIDTNENKSKIEKKIINENKINKNLIYEDNRNKSIEEMIREGNYKKNENNGELTMSKIKSFFTNIFGSMSKSISKDKDNKIYNESRLQELIRIDFENKVIPYDNITCENKRFKECKLYSFIEVIPDVEGYFDKLLRYIELSKIFTNESKIYFRSIFLNNKDSKYDLAYDMITLKQYITVNEDIYEDYSYTKLVFTGDLFDRGLNNLLILKFMLILLDKYPTRVICTLGNREIYKLSLISELSDDKLDLTREDAFINEELKEDFELNKKRYENNIKNNKNDFTSFIINDKYEGYRNGLIEDYILSDKIIKLKFLLIYLCNAKDLFDNLKEELKMIFRYSDTEVTDEIVLECVLYILLPKFKNYNGTFNNFSIFKVKDNMRLNLYDMISRSVLIYYNEYNKAIFSHGFINVTNFGFLPDDDTDNYYINEISDTDTLVNWVNNLNKWFNDKLRLNHYDKILKYIMRSKSDKNNEAGTINKRSVVSNRQYNENFKLITDNGINNTNLLKLNKFICGHTPIGNIPLIIKDNNKILLFADTSYNHEDFGLIIVSIDGINVYIKSDINSENIDVRLNSKDNIGKVYDNTVNITEDLSVNIDFTKKKFTYNFY